MPKWLLSKGVWEIKLGLVCQQGAWEQDQVSMGPLLRRAFLTNKFSGLQQLPILQSQGELYRLTPAFHKQSHQPQHQINNIFHLWYCGRCAPLVTFVKYPFNSLISRPSIIANRSGRSGKTPTQNDVRWTFGGVAYCTVHWSSPEVPRLQMYVHVTSTQEFHQL